MNIELLTVEKLYRDCERLVNENKGDYKVYLAAGGYCDGTAEARIYVNDDDGGELVLSTP